MSKEVLQMKYHPAKQEVKFQYSQNGKYCPISDENNSDLKIYENKGGSFVLQNQGNTFLKDIAAFFSSELTGRVEVVTTENDYEDFKQMVDFYNAKKSENDTEIDSILLSKLQDMEKIFSAVKEHGELSRDILKKNHEKFTEVLKNTNNTIVKKCVNEFADGVKKEIINISEKIEAMADTNVNLCFIGVYSSGKSALINAIIGYKILPEDSNPKTARMFRIQSPKPDEDVRIEFHINDEKTILIWNNESEVFGFAAGPVNNKSRRAIQDTINNNSGKQRHEQICEILDTLNTNNGISSEINVFFKIPIDNDKVQFTIYDTPGTDSNNDTHQNVLRTALSEQTHSILIFVVHPHKLEGEGNNILLNCLTEAEKNDSKTSIDIRRSLFVINHADTLNTTKAREAYQISEIKNKEDSNFSINLSDKKLFFTSAMYAYAAAAVKNNIATDKEKDDFDDWYNRIQRHETGRYFLQNRCALSEMATNRQRNKSTEALKDAIDRKDKEEIFHICSGLYSLEEEIKLYGKKFATTVKASAIITSVNRALSNMVKQARLLRKEHQADKDKIDKEIEDLRSAMTDSINKVYEKYLISSNESLPEDILEKLHLTASYLNKTIVGETKDFIEKLLHLPIFGEVFKGLLVIIEKFPDIGKKLQNIPVAGKQLKVLGEPLQNVVERYKSFFDTAFFKEEHKETINKKIESVWLVFEGDFRKERQELLEQQRDNFMETIKEIIRKNNNGNISEEAKEFVLDVRPSDVKIPDNIGTFGEIYDRNKRENKFFGIFTIEKNKFVHEVEKELTDMTEKIAEDFKSDYRENLKSLLSEVESEFTQNLETYSIDMKAKFEDKEVIEQLGDKILSVVDELETCRKKFEEIIWKEEK